MIKSKKLNLLIVKRIFPAVCFTIYLLTTLLKEEKGAQSITLEELKNEREQMKINFKLEQTNQELEANELLISDRKSAREMGQKNPIVPGILTLIFTLGFFGMTAFMLRFLLDMANVEMNDFVVSFVSYIFGAFNAIMIQIISYYFGASKGGDDNGAKMADSFRQAAGK